MKTLTAAFMLGLSVGLLGTANAEPFNDRGELFLTTVTPSAGAAAPMDLEANLTAFNERGINFQQEVAISRGPAVCPLDGTPAANGFYERGRNFITAVDLEQAQYELGNRWAGDDHVTKC